MTTLWRDLRYAARLLVKRPVFTTIVVINLALGVGANTAIFSVVNAVLIHPLPFRDSDRLVALGEVNSEISPTPVKVSLPNLRDLGEQGGVFEQLVAYRERRMTMLDGAEPSRLNVQSVSAGFFPMLGVEPLLGRAFRAPDDGAGREKEVTLSYGFWQRHFGADRGVLGRQITLDDAAYTVTGVMPRDFQFLREADAWAPLETPASMQQRGARVLQVVGKLKPGVTIAEAGVRVDAVARRLQQAYPDTNAGWGMSIEPLQERLIGRLGQRLLILFGAVTFILLIACANIANLMLAQATTRQREFAIRVALGARRSQLLRQSLTMSLLLGVSGGALGVLTMGWGMQSILAWSGGNIPRLGEVKFDATVLSFALAVSLLSTVLFGSAPAFWAARPELNQLLKGASAYQSSGLGWLRRHGLQDILVAAEIALAQVLLIGAALLYQSFLNLTAVDLGFDPANVISMEVSLPGYRYAEPKQRAAFFTQLLQRAASLPDVSSVALTNSLPLDGVDYKNSFTVKDSALPETEWASIRTVSADYFRTMGIPLLEGRSFDNRDVEGAPPVVIVNLTMKRRFWPEGAVGRRVTFDDDSYTVVGVSGDVRETSLDAEAPPELYFPMLQGPQSSMVLVARAKTEPTRLAAPLRAQVQGIDKSQPVEKVQTLSDVVSRSVTQPRFTTILLGLFAALALILAVSGTYGVISYMVSLRTREIGIRMALGASADDVLWLMVRRGMGLAVIGGAVGLAGSVALARYMSSFLFGISAVDPATFVMTSLLLAVVALFACYVPARRAAKVDPLIALRNE